MDALWMKCGNRLVPADPWTEEWLASIPDKVFVQTNAPTLPRNVKYHKRIMAMLSKVVEQTWPRFADVNELMDWLKIRSGMVREVYVVEGVVKLAFKSISFSSMDQRAFQALVDKWIAIICTDLMPGTDPEALLEAE